MTENGAGDGTFRESPSAPNGPYGRVPAAWPPSSVPPTNTKAIWSLVLGIASIPAILTVCGGFLAGIPAVILGFLARRDIRLSGGAEGGRGLATGGIVTGIIGIVLGAVAVAALGASWWHANERKEQVDSWQPPTSSDTASTSAELAEFYRQKLTWSSCDVGKCTWVTVPVDYAKPSGQTLKLRVNVIPATGAGGRSLFLNPGGPGGSALDFGEYMALTFGPAIRHRYDLVSVDPRGVGESTPVDCLSDQAFDKYAASDPDPDSEAEIAVFRKSTVDFGDGCLKRSGAVAEHISTEEAARDFDIVRALIGRDKLDWFGASYGTQLGATYATLFPKRVGRMVLDGAVDPDLDTIDSALGQAGGFQTALDAYVQDCVRKESCPLGKSVSQAGQRIAAFLQSLDKAPLRTGESRRLTEGLGFYGIAVTLYDKETWPILSQALSAAFDGDAGLLLNLADYYFDRKGDGSYSGNLGESFPAISCLDVSDHPSMADIEAAMPQFEKVSPAFGRAMAWGALSCTDWPIKATHPQIKVHAAKAAPIVVVGTTRDPATPYTWAEALTKELGGRAVLLTREGDGHTGYTSGNRCVVDAIDNYLADGTVPKAGTVCR